MGIPAVYVEKDYWVTYALSVLFNSVIGKDIVFKGGTALSKCHHIIERFSEDIDLVVLRRKGDTDSRLKAKLKAVSGVLEDVLPETAIEGITNKKGMIRKTAHSYTREFKGD
jgi:predicted nucleotidyltransferase component of viral defense system